MEPLCDIDTDIAGEPGLGLDAGLLSIECDEKRFTHELASMKLTPHAWLMNIPCLESTASLIAGKIIAFSSPNCRLSTSNRSMFSGSAPVEGVEGRFYSDCKHVEKVANPRCSSY